MVWFLKGESFMPFYYRDIRYLSWENFKEEIGNQISCEELLDLLQKDPDFLNWIYEESPDFDYEKVGQYLFTGLSTTEWLDVFADKSPKTWEEIMEEMLGEELYSEVKKVKEKAEEAERKRKEAEEAERKRKAAEEERRRKAAAEERKRTEERVNFLTSSQNLRPGNSCILYIENLPFPFRWCPSGYFMMGEGSSRHNEYISGFWMLETPVTQEMWQRIMGNNPSHFAGRPKNPVERVSWFDAIVFCNRLTQRTQRLRAWNLEFGLPTEVQWEYACVAGNHHSGSDFSTQVMWSAENSNQRTHKVGQNSANAWGLRDMCGNVFEWCAYNSKYIDFLNLRNKTKVCAICGGSYLTPRKFCTPYYRDFLEIDKCRDNLGFRIVLKHRM